VIIIGIMMKVIAGTTAAAIAAESGTAAAGTTAAGTTTGTTAAGIGTGTMVAIGAGAAAGGIAAVAASSGDGDGGIDWDNPFTGTFKWEQTQDQGCDSDAGEYRCTVYVEVVWALTQGGNSVTGNCVGTGIVENCCTANATYAITGTIEGTIATLTLGAHEFGCEGSNCSFNDDLNAITVNATLIDNGRILRGFNNQFSFELIRQ
jgi:hypothetical protein